LKKANFRVAIEDIERCEDTIEYGTIINQMNSEDIRNKLPISINK